MYTTSSFAITLEIDGRLLDSHGQRSRSAMGSSPLRNSQSSAGPSPQIRPWDCQHHTVAAYTTAKPGLAVDVSDRAGHPLHPARKPTFSASLRAGKRLSVGTTCSENRR